MRRHVPAADLPSLSLCAGDEALRLQQDLPLGRGHVCLDPTRLPPTLKQIFADSMMKDLA